MKGRLNLSDIIDQLGGLERVDQQTLDALAFSHNAGPLEDFLGLSPDEMSLLLHSPIEELFPLFTLNHHIDKRLFKTAPILVRARTLLSSLHQAGEVKATARGNLPKKIANAVYQVVPERPENLRFTLNSEERSPMVKGVRGNLTSCGWMKLRNRKFSLTKAGQRIVENDFLAEDFISLFLFRLCNYNWAYEDLLPELPFFQRSGLFLLYFLTSREQHEFTAEDLSQAYLRAFPTIREDIPEHEFWTAEKIVEMIGESRFLKRFAWVFGLVEITQDDSLSYLEREKSRTYRATELLRELVRFKPGLTGRLLSSGGGELN